MVSVTVLGARSLFRAGLVDLLGASGFSPIDQADDTGGLNLDGDAPPGGDMLITILARGAGEVAEMVRAIRTRRPSAGIVCLVPEFDFDQMRLCFAAGASGYVLECVSREALTESLRLVAVGEKVFPSELAAEFPRLGANLDAGEARASAPPKADLSRREVEILECLAMGQSNKVIANSLGIAEATVKVHLKRILRKARVANRTQAALWAIATGMAPAPTAANAFRPERDDTRERAVPGLRTAVAEPRSFREGASADRASGDPPELVPTDPKRSPSLVPEAVWYAPAR